ncbi:hypothetical protein ROS62_06405 [Streptomyces sp. DSM 41972]|uniref:DUF732 domain-containing protein n=1 Tax=Streptomyces althioticus subsp. attaecolombicae TaxID=3075534 RepID=A0ABU3HYH7_9ACTN|nr:hypothetical protein [Streptomyces sp. DSM 41972]SCD33182.1 hypothetical protein GA0115245_10322 [Streptomyces sp. di188]SCD44873.1 hypothetical protein GA0115238_10952 [Streptomyces sp. di50b]
MRTRTAAALIAALAVTLVGCSSDDSKTEAAASSSSAQPSATHSTQAADRPGIDASEADDVLPAEPTGAERDAVLAVVMDVSAKLLADEDKAIDAARNQCGALNSGAANVDHLAAQRFSYDGVTLTDEDGAHLNTGLRKTLCPED